MTESPLTIATRELLKSRDRTVTYDLIVAEINGGITTHWLKKFVSQSDCHDHGANRLTRLYEYLSKKKLEIV